MHPIIPHNLLIATLVAAVILAAGCFNQGDTKEDDEGHFDTCVFVFRTDNPPNAYQHPVNESTWRNHAPNMSRQLDENITQPKPLQIGGHCPFYRNEARWLLQNFTEAPGATSTAIFPGVHYFLFNITIGDGHHVLHIYGSNFGYPQHP